VKGSRLLRFARNDSLQQNVFYSTNSNNIDIITFYFNDIKDNKFARKFALHSESFNPELNFCSLNLSDNEKPDCSFCAKFRDPTNLIAVTAMISQRT